MREAAGEQPLAVGLAVRAGFPVGDRLPSLRGSARPERREN